MLLLLCHWKDIDISEWKLACNTLLNVNYAMHERHQLSQLKSCTTISQRVMESDHCELEKLKHKLHAVEQLKNQEIEKLQTEINWLQHRLAEKLQQTRRQNDIIDELKRDLVESVQQTEISEGRRLCYEHRIRALEGQLEQVLHPKIHKSMDTLVTISNTPA